MRVAVARLWHEGNSFTPVLTRLADFHQREWAEGAGAADFYRGSRTEIGAAVDFFAANRALTPIYLRCTGAGPGGPVEETDLQRVFMEIVEGVRTAGADGLYLSLHGALIGEKTLKADLVLLQAVREALGARPLAVSFDLHANLDPAMADLADIVVGYKTYPHVDMYETGTKSLRLLVAAVEGRIRPVAAIAKVGAVLPSFRMRTAEGPMAQVEALAARRAGEIPCILDATPFGGFAYADTPCAGASVSVTADGDRSAAQALARDLAGEMLRLRDQFAVSLPKPETVFSFRKLAKPAAILEPSDNPLSGGVGDTTGLLRALLAQGRQYRTVFAFFWDPELVRQCEVKKKLTARLGGRLSPAWGPPVQLEVEVERVTDGRFRNAGPMERGLEVTLGRTAVLRSGNLRIIVTESCQSPNDGEFFRLHGVDLAEVDLVCVKAKNHFRAAFADAFDPIIEVDTAGPAAASLASLPFKNVPKEMLG
jgi:microcystin degradation protein MlrC